MWVCSLSGSLGLPLPFLFLLLGNAPSAFLHFSFVTFLSASCPGFLSMYRWAHMINSILLLNLSASSLLSTWSCVHFVANSSALRFPSLSSGIIPLLSACSGVVCAFTHWMLWSLWLSLIIWFQISLCCPLCSRRWPLRIPLAVPWFFAWSCLMLATAR